MLSALSGALWVAGQLGQYKAFARIGVSRTIPISAGLQRVGTSLVGVFVFGEWASAKARLIGFGALTLVMAGVFLTTLKTDKEGGGLDKGALLLLFLTDFGYMAYSAIPDIVGSGGTTIFLPQAMGMLCAAVAYAVLSGRAAVLKEPGKGARQPPEPAFRAGFFHWVGYIISAQHNGIATGFALAQRSVAVATISGILILHEKKTSFELRATLTGLFLIVAGGAAIAFM